VIRDADDKGLIELASELETLARRARDRELGAEEMKGASFSITNLGSLGTTRFTPIVAWPEVAILGVGRTRSRLVLEDGEVAEHTFLPLCLSYDHRALDGADAARFTRAIAEALETPMRLLL
jgi:pyruvate dehydrogenase E2 component (dihydrolipoamide acetyltransferase)